MFRISRAAQLVLKPALTSALIVAAICPRLAAAPSARNSAIDPHAGETKAHRDARMKWWREARFGMFIHWGLYAVPAGYYQGKPVPGIGEWIMHTAHIPVATYAAYAPEFNPKRFNADQWVSIARAAGMKYIVMTAKHHEGFAMYHTGVDGYNIFDATPFKREPIAEMAAACRRQGIKFGVYYSQNLDWHHPGGGTAGPAWDPAQLGNFDQYVRTVAAPQVRELISRFRPAVLWWDIPGAFTPDEVRALTSSFASEPELIFNNRLGGGVPGDFGTPEQHIPATGLSGQDWETCMTINDTWGYKRDDTNFKSATTLIRNLVDIASKGGNYLLNVGPTAQGIIPQPEVDRLRAMGAWLAKNGRSIYGSSASPYRRLPFDGRVTVRDHHLYLHVFTWPETGLTLPGLKTPVRTARVLATGERLTLTRDTGGDLSISRPTPLDPVATTLDLALSGPPAVVDQAIVISPQQDGRLALLATDAVLHRSALQVEHEDTTPNLGYWTNPADTAEWRVTVPDAAAGDYNAVLDYSCEPGSEGATFELQVDGVLSGVREVVQNTGGWGNYQKLNLNGALHLTPGTHTIRVVTTHMPGGAVMNLRSILLQRA